MHFATRAIHAAQPSDPSTAALIAPIYQTSTYEQAAPGINQGFDYSRTNNPTRQRLEAVIAEFEGVSHCLTFVPLLISLTPAARSSWLTTRSRRRYFSSPLRSARTSSSTV